VELDGRLDEWDLSGELLLGGVGGSQGARSARLSAMHDEGSLYVALRVKDPTPLVNHVDPKENPDKGWQGDCIQIRFKTSGPASSEVVYLGSWFHSDGKRAALRACYPDLAKGLDHRVPVDALTARGACAFRVDEDHKGYCQELRIPWRLLLAKGRLPQPGTAYRMGIEVIWGPKEKGGREVHRVTDLVAYRGVNPRGFYGKMLEWGRLVLVEEGELTEQQKEAIVSQEVSGVKDRKVETIQYLCSADESEQPALWYAPESDVPLPLLVGLHSWSTDHRNAGQYAKWCLDRHWVFIGPDFRGPNKKPTACGSELAVQDIVDAVAYARNHANVDPRRIYLVGASGGGHAAMLMAGRAPEIWAGVSAWAGISDLRAWHAECKKAGRHYAGMIEKCCGGPPGASPEVDEQYRQRSPLTYLPKARNVMLDLNAGIHDGHTGSVPVSHSLNAFNAVAAEKDRLSKEDIRHFVQMRQVPERLKRRPGEPPWEGEKTLFQRTSGKVRITVLDGGHGILQDQALQWIARQQKQEERGGQDVREGPASPNRGRNGPSITEPESPASGAGSDFNLTCTWDHVNVFPAASVARQGKQIVVDGDLSDWEDEAFVLLYQGPKQRETHAIQIAFAYDKEGLLLAARVTDASPLSSHVDPHTHPDRGWDGDALQVRLVSSSRIRKPVPHEELNGDQIAHLTIWYFAPKNTAAINVAYGMNLLDPRTLIGKESGFVFRKGKEGENAYSLEGRVPWSLLHAKEAEPGASWLCTLQPLWGNAKGKPEHSFFDIVTGGGIQYQSPDGWGEAHFVERDEVRTCFEEQAEFRHWRTRMEEGGYEAALKYVAHRVCDCVDWARPELKDRDFTAACRKGRYLEAALGLVRYLREREEPILEYSKEWVAKVRAEATAEERAAARRKFREGNHAPRTYALGPKREDFEQWARQQLDGMAKWGLGAWGTTRSITREISKAWHLDECPDEAFIPWFGRLVRQLPGEWRASMKWNENGMANAGHNWWVVTYRGFYQAGLYFPEFKGFERFRALAPTWLEYEASCLFAPDGFSRERSGYHWVAGDLWDCAEVAMKNGVEFSPEFHKRMKLAREVNLVLVTPDGNLPAIGDGMLAYRSPDDRPKTHPTLEKAAARYGNRVDTCLPDSGYYLMREDWTTASDYVLIDAGARGNGVTSHDMSCIFHFQLHANGRCILTSQGCGPYDKSRERMWRRGDMSHNCATVDGEVTVPYSGVHGFDAVVMPSVEHWISKAGYAYFSGVHEGYGRKGIGVPSTRRKLLYLRGGYWVLIDRFTSGSPAAEHSYQLNFQLAAPAELREDGSVVTKGKGGNLLILPVEGARGEAELQDCPLPLKGQFNPRVLTYTKKCVGHALLVTVLVPVQDDKTPAARVRLLDVQADLRVVSPWEITALEITIDGERDVYVDQHMHWNLPWEAGGCRGQERLFHSRCHAPE